MKRRLAIVAAAFVVALAAFLLVRPHSLLSLRFIGIDDYQRAEVEVSNSCSRPVSIAYYKVKVRKNPLLMPEYRSGYWFAMPLQPHEVRVVRLEVPTQPCQWQATIYYGPDRPTVSKVQRVLRRAGIKLDLDPLQTVNSSIFTNAAP